MKQMKHTFGRNETSHTSQNMGGGVAVIQQGVEPTCSTMGGPKRKQNSFEEIVLSEQIKRFRISNTPGELRLQKDMKDLIGRDGIEFSYPDDPASVIVHFCDGIQNAPNDFRITVPRFYPHVKPTVYCMNESFTCQYITATGELVHAGLDENWSAVGTLGDILDAIQSVRLFFQCDHSNGSSSNIATATMMGSLPSASISAPTKMAGKCHDHYHPSYHSQSPASMMAEQPLQTSSSAGGGLIHRQSSNGLESSRSFADSSSFGLSLHFSGTAASASASASAGTAAAAAAAVTAATILSYPASSSSSSFDEGGLSPVGISAVDLDDDLTAMISSSSSQRRIHINSTSADLSSINQPSMFLQRGGRPAAYTIGSGDDTIMMNMTTNAIASGSIGAGNNTLLASAAAVVGISTAVDDDDDDDGDDAMASSSVLAAAAAAGGGGVGHFIPMISADPDNIIISPGRITPADVLPNTTAMAMDSITAIQPMGIAPGHSASAAPLYSSSSGAIVQQGQGSHVTPPRAAVTSTPWLGASSAPVVFPVAMHAFPTAFSTVQTVQWDDGDGDDGDDGESDNYDMANTSDDEDDDGDDGETDEDGSAMLQNEP